jgi:hypothetical protein
VIVASGHAHHSLSTTKTTHQHCGEARDESGVHNIYAIAHRNEVRNKVPQDVKDHDVHRVHHREQVEAQRQAAQEFQNATTN